MRSSNVSPMGHREAWEIIPWYVNGSLDGGELEQFEEHLSTCDVCRREIATEERWAREIRASEELVYSPERAFAELRGRLMDSDGAAAPNVASAPGWWRRATGSGSRALRIALVAQAAAIVALVGILWLQPGTPQFRTVSDAPSASVTAGASVRVVFREEITERELRDLLLASGLHLVDGPSPRGVYTLAVAPERLDAAVTALRASSLTRFAEPQ